MFSAAACAVDALGYARIGTGDAASPHRTCYNLASCGNERPGRQDNQAECAQQTSREREASAASAKITARESVVFRSGLRCRAAQAVLALTRRTPIAARRPALISSHVSGSGIARALTVKLPL